MSTDLEAVRFLNASESDIAPEAMPFSGINNPNVSGGPSGNSWADIFAAQARLDTAQDSNRAMTARSLARETNTSQPIVTPARETPLPTGPSTAMQAHNRNMQTTFTDFTQGGTRMSRNEYLDDLDMEMPELGAAPTLSLPEFTMPEVDQSRVDFLSGRAGSGDRFAMKGALREGISAANRVDNPNVRKMQNRALLRGYGEGLGRIMDSSRRAGLSEYMSTEFNPSVQKAKMDYQGGVNTATAAYNAANQDRMTNYNREMNTYNTNRAMQNRSYGLA